MLCEVSAHRVIAQPVVPRYPRYAITSGKAKVDSWAMLAGAYAARSWHATSIDRLGNLVPETSGDDVLSPRRCSSPELGSQLAVPHDPESSSSHR
jgi:hypothetical protein